MARPMSRLDVVLLLVGLAAMAGAALLEVNDIGWELVRYALGVGAVVVMIWAFRNVPPYP